MALRFKRAHDRLLTEEAAQRDPKAAARRAEAWQTYEYKSPWRLLGVPLIHVRSGRPRGEKLRPAVGWIAIGGDVSFGVLISIGGIAFGGISIGGCSVGLVALGGVSLGGLAFGGLAVGFGAAVGGLAIGYLAHGGCALAWHAAQGGMAVARDFAVGGSVQAAHANDALAREAIGSLGFFRHADVFVGQPLLINLVWLPLLLVLWQAQRARRALKARP